MDRNNLLVKFINLSFGIRSNSVLLRNLNILSIFIFSNTLPKVKSHTPDTVSFSDYSLRNPHRK